MLLLLGSTKSVYFFWDTRYLPQQTFTYFKKKSGLSEVLYIFIREYQLSGIETSYHYCTNSKNSTKCTSLSFDQESVWNS